MTARATRLSCTSTIKEFLTGQGFNQPVSDPTNRLLHIEGTSVKGIARYSLIDGLEEAGSYLASVHVPIFLLDINRSVYVRGKNPPLLTQILQRQGTDG